jgi:ABC-type amino acid transport substrate-binding protein
VYAYARVGDTRFDNNPDAINQPDITIVAAEGASPAVIANNDFPKAKKILMPELASLADVLVALATSKADVAIANPEAAQAYDTSNPGKIHRISAKMPLRVFGNCLAVGGGQDRFRRMLDIATGEMLASGQIEKMIATYAPAPGIWLAASPPYQIDTR